MPNIPQLVAAIDGRLAEIAAEVSALDAARAKLAVPGAERPDQAIAKNPTPRSRQAGKRRRVRPPSQSPAAAGQSVAPERVTASPAAGSRRATASRPAPGRAPRARRPSPRSGAVEAETVERLLADSPAGLSANAVATLTGVGYTRTRKLLHELEAGGRVRRSGARRSSVWQVITDEQRIAERAAELERLR